MDDSAVVRSLEAVGDLRRQPYGVVRGPYFSVSAGHSPRQVTGTTVNSPR